MEGIYKILDNETFIEGQNKAGGYAEEIFQILETDLIGGTFSLQELENKGFVFEEEINGNTEQFYTITKLEEIEQKIDYSSMLVFNFYGIKVLFTKDEFGNFVFEEFEGDIAVNN